MNNKNQLERGHKKLVHLKDKELLQQTKNLVQKERELITEILHHLKEIETRRLFTTLGCTSLFSYCVEILKYSEAQAQRRISAMRLIRQIPEVEEKLSKGILSLTNIAQAQSFFRQEEKVKKEGLKLSAAQSENSSFSSIKSINDQPLGIKHKKQILKKLEDCSSREGQKRLASLSSVPESYLKKSLERQRIVSSTITEVRFGADENLLKKIEQIKGLLAHKKPHLNTSELIEELCDIAFQKLNPEKKKTNRKKSEVIQKPLPAPEVNLRQKPKNKRTYISVAKKKEVWVKAKSQCETCGSIYALEIDHLKPISMGGENELNNLRLLCRSCNQRAAIEKLGLERVRSFIE